MDCQGNSGTNGCPSGTACCGSLVYDGTFGATFICNTQSLTTSCQSTCTDAPPAITAFACGTVGSPKTYTVHMCNAASECSGTNGKCCSFGLLPYAYCVPNSEVAFATNCY